MKMSGMCINKRVVAGVAVTAALLWWLAPGTVSAALPLIVFAVCPLSMLLMVKAMDRSGAAPAAASDAAPLEAPAALGDNSPAGALTAPPHDVS